MGRQGGRGNTFAPDYIDVAQRIADFRAKHPEGSLQPLNHDKPYDVLKVGDQTFIVYAAAAYRHPDDPRPGVGVAYEPFPGKTPYTRDSELQNAETSAWGRAIIAVGASDAKHGVSSSDEIRNRQADQAAPPVDRPPPPERERAAANGTHPTPAADGRGRKATAAQRGAMHGAARDANLDDEARKDLTWLVTSGRVKSSTGEDLTGGDVDQFLVACALLKAGHVNLGYTGEGDLKLVRGDGSVVEFPVDAPKVRAWIETHAAPDAAAGESGAVSAGQGTLT